MAEDVGQIIHNLELGLVNLRSHVDLENAKIRGDIITMTNAVNELKSSQAGLSAALKDQADEDKGNYVTNERYKTVERIVLGGAGFVLIAVLTAIVALVVK